MDFLKKLGSGLVEEATEKLQTTLTEGASDAMSSLTGSVTKSLLGKAAGTDIPQASVPRRILSAVRVPHFPRPFRRGRKCDGISLASN